MITKLRRRGFPTRVELVHGCGQRLRPGPELWGKLYLYSAAWFTIEDRSAWYRTAEHLFQTDRLGAKLYQVAVGRLPLAALVFDRERFGTELNDIGATCEPKPPTLQP